MESIKKLHAHLIVTGLYTYPFPISKVFTFYALSPSNLLRDAQLLFDHVKHPTPYFWNILIRAFSQSSTPQKALLLYNQMRAEGLKQDNLTFPFVFKACSKVPVAIREGTRIHSHALKLGFLSDVFVSNALVHFYASCGELHNARLVFDEMPVRDLVSWNSLICGYGQCNHLREVLSLFEAMKAEGVKADKVTMVKVVSACTHLGEWDLAESMVEYIAENHVEVDVYLGNTLIDYYGRRGSVESAKRVFDKMKEKNIVTLNAMITTYSKAGDLISARKIFDSMMDKDLISWSSMITGYSQANHFKDALLLFRKMQLAKIRPDEIVLVSVLSACAHLGALSLGKWIHNYIRRNNINADIYVGNSLIDMYSKCGCTKEALQVFKEMKERDLLTWNSMILGLATNGSVESALEIFSAMSKEGLKPDDVTFLGVLIACAHSGLVDKGIEYFKSMKEVHGIDPQMKHYGCVVDLLSRKGELAKAFELVVEMPITPDPVIWRTLLGACKVHGNVGLAEVVNKKLVEVDPGNSGNYVLMSNTYAGTDRWSDAMKVRETMAESMMRKPPGCSSVEVSNLDREGIVSDGRLSRKNQAAIA